MDHVDDWRKEVERELETLREHFRKREAELDKKYAPLRALSETLASCPDLAKHLQRIGQDLEKNADLAGSRAYLKAAGLFGSIEAQYVYGKNAGDYEALLRAAELGHPDAMLDLAKMMESGGQTSEAVRWYGEAEKRGNALAQMARITLQTRVTKEDKARRQSHLVLTGDDGDSDCDDDCGNEHGDKDRDAQLMNEMMGGNSDA
jgi:TPR repeat protein